MPEAPIPIHVTVDIYLCARCGANHEGVEFKRFMSPMRDSDGAIWEWWGMCPLMNEPILLRHVQPEQK